MSMSPRNQRRRQRRAIKAAARRANRAIRMIGKQVFFDIETVGFLSSTRPEPHVEPIVLIGSPPCAMFAADRSVVAHRPPLVVFDALGFPAMIKERNFG